jgi:transcription elongation factor Elf1
MKTPHKECLTCNRLGKSCKEVNSIKLQNRWFCTEWGSSTQEEVNARVRAINEYGAAAVAALVTPRPEEGR